MAAASYSSQVQQRVEEANQSPTPENTDDVANPTTPEHSDDVERLDEAIQNLPPELREKIYKDYVATKQKEREVMGWKKVHEALEQIDTDRKCLECGIRRLVGISPICRACEVCTNCGRSVQEECPACGSCLRGESQLCWVCYETEEECDTCPIHERCYVCDSCVCPSRQMRPL